MNIIILLAILISIYGIKVNIKGYNESYISKKQTTAINGLFVVLVFLGQSFFLWGNDPVHAHYILKVA